jgi:hypothetical protein
MRKWSKNFLALLLAIGIRVNAQESTPLKLLHTTQLPGFAGDLDHLAADLKGHRLFVTAEVHKTVEVFDLNTGERIHSIAGFETPHELLFLPRSNMLLVADGGSPGTCKLVNGKTYQIVKTITLPPGVDSAAYNPVTKEFYVESRGPDPSADTHSISVIAAEAFQHTGDFTLPGRRSEAMAIDAAGKTMYVNLTDEVGVVDLAARRLTARWPVPDAHVQNSMALDEPNHRLFIATRNPPKLFVFNTDDGKVVVSLPLRGRQRRHDLRSQAEAYLCHWRRRHERVCSARCQPLRTHRGCSDRVSRQDLALCAAIESALYRRLGRQQAGCASGPADLSSATLRSEIGGIETPH